MRLSQVVYFAACCGVSAAFKNTFPFVLFSTSGSSLTNSHDSVRSSASVSHDVERFVGSCPSDDYVVISHEGLEPSDLSDSTSFPYLHQLLFGKDIKTSVTVSEVTIPSLSQSSESKTDLNAESIRNLIDEHCKVQSVRISLTDLPRSPAARTAKLQEADARIKSVIDKLSSSYTVFYLASPAISEADESFYAPVFQEPLRTAMKRDSSFVNTRAENSTFDNSLPLFEKYSFFTPGIFAGLLVTFILLAILAVGISAVASLQVSYGAFDKEMGPASQRKA